MNIRDLTYLTTVARLKHFGKAAETCNVSQPGLSTQIKKLEEELGVTLLERDKRTVRLTRIGQDITDLAHEALSVIDKIYQTASASQDPLAGEFQLGAIPTIAPYLIPNLMLKTREALPELKIEFEETITERINEKLLDGDLDAAILATAPDTHQLEAIELYDEPFWVLYPQDHALTHLPVIRTEELPFNEVLLLSEGHCFRDQALDLCRLDVIQDNHTIRASSLETLVRMVKARQGVTLIPTSALLGGWIDDEDICRVRLEDPRAFRRVYLTYRKNSSRTALLSWLAALICDIVPDGMTILYESESRLTS